MDLQRNVVGWFELPVLDMERAMRFYETVFDFELSRHRVGPLDMAWFPAREGAEGSPGSLVCYPDVYQPKDNGVVIYFTAHSGDLANELGRVEEAGGKILQGKTQISEAHGFMALLLDTEGNRIALHCRKG